MNTRHFEFIANKITSAKRAAESLVKGIGHHGIEGEIREIAARECIEPFLTQSYACGTGKVIDTYQTLSDQIDLVIYHKKVAPPILVNRDLGLFPVECVRYVFEVKSTLTAAEVRDTNKKFQSVRKLRSFPRKTPDGKVTYGALPSTVLLAFSSDISGSEIDRYLKHTEGDTPPCSVICVLGKGYWFYEHGDKKWYGRERHEEDHESLEFCMFMTGFMNTLAGEETSMRPFAPGSYMRLEDIILMPVTSRDA